ncbi:MAG: hypothetical protein BRD23_06290 [Halobacteriales archaeon SW_9_67_25]|jgi:hypothetical protein|nr:MAG: hypothetical protein BRD23_06290 [Halobacteriales archaeon SW_9_67_25]
MSAVPFTDSLRYGGTLVGYLLAVALVSAGALVGGAVLAAPGRIGLDAAAVGTGRLAGGVALAALGAVLFLAGLVGLTHKLVADAVSVGVEHGESAVEPQVVTGSGEAATESLPTDTSGPDEPVQGATEDAPSTAASEPDLKTAADSPPAVSDTEAETPTADASADSPEERPAPSPEEIVFGTTDDPVRGENDGSSGVDTSDAEEDEPDWHSPRGRDSRADVESESGSGGDPLVDPTEEE